MLKISENIEVLSGKCVWILTLLFMLSFQLTGYSQDDALGILRIKNYTTADYFADPQNWAIIQAPNGMIYAGNTEGVLEYDGATWRLIPIAKKSRVRSLAVDTLGNVYVGAVGEIGLIETNKLGPAKYRSLTAYLPQKFQNIGEVWRTFVIGNSIYFQIEESVFILTKSNEKYSIKIIQPKTSFHSSFSVDNYFLIRQRKIGLQIWKEDSLKLLPGGEKFASTGISEIIAIAPHKWLITTRIEGLFLYDGKKCIPFASQHKEFFIEHQIYDALLLNNGNIALGTLNFGVVIINQEGKIIQIINKSSGLLDNNVWFLYLDKEENLWVCLEKGISKININSPFTLFNEATGLRGEPKRIVRHNGRLYVATSQGLFFFKSESNQISNDFQGINPNTFESVDGILSGCFEILILNNDLLTINSEGVYKIVNNEAILLYKCYGYSALRLKSDPEKILIGTDSGIEIIDISTSPYHYLGKIQGLEDDVREIVEDQDGSVWIGTSFNGVSRLKFSSGQYLNPVIQSFGLKDGLPSLELTYVCHLDNKVLFTSPSGIYFFNKVTNKFEQDNYFPSEIQNQSITYNLQKDALGQIWIMGYKKQLNTKGPFQSVKTFSFLAREIKNDQKNNRRMSVEYHPLLSNYAGSVSYVFSESDKMSWICTSGGLIRYNMNAKLRAPVKFRVVLRNAIIDNQSIIENNLHPTKTSDTDLISDTKITYHEKNKLIVYFAALSYTETQENYYQYFLENYDTEWSGWTNTSFAEYTSLEPGDYKFFVRARNMLGGAINTATLSFIISPPWYLTLSAKIAYGVLFIFSLYTGFRYVKKNIEKRNEQVRIKLENMVYERTLEVEKQKKILETQASRLEEHSKDLAILGKIGRELTSTLEFEEIFQNLYRYTNSLVDATTFAIHVINSEKHVLECKFFMEHHQRQPEISIPLDDETKLAVRCVKSGMEIIIKDSTQELDFESGETTILYGSLTRSVIYLPLKVKNKIIGDLTVQSLEPDAYSSEDLEILRSLAAYTAIALDNASAYSAIDRQKEKLTSAYIKIEDSIQYARRIQDAILPDKIDIEKYFPSSFIFYQPREIVSGDFYWFASVNNYKIIAAVDCTGHGVPGAFMSVLGSSLLDEIIKSREIVSPAEILNLLNQSVLTALKQYQKESSILDGMDIALISINQDFSELKFAGANRPITLVSNGIVELINGNKFPIGGKFLNHSTKEFDEYATKLNKGDRIYLYTDGYADQFGGGKRQKFLNKRLIQLIESQIGHPFSDNYDTFKATFNTWKNNTPQLDDVLVIGIEV